MTVTVHTPYQLGDQVALRPEPFGALAYNYTNRRLVFLRTPEMVQLVDALADATDVAAAFDTVGIPSERHEAYLTALGDLEHAGVIHARR